MSRAFNINRIEFIDKKRTILKLEGFYVDENKKHAFIKLDTQEILLKRNIRRHDISQFFSNEETLLGFETYIFVSNIDKVLKIFIDDSIVFEKEISKIDNSKSNEETILFSIDIFEKYSSKEYVVKGWAFSLSKLDKNIDIILENVNKYTVESENSDDVEAAFSSLKFNHKVRFEIKISQKIKKKLKIIFFDGENSKKIEIKLPIFSKKSKIHKGLKYIKNYGIINFIKFMKNRTIPNSESYKNYILNERKIKNKINYTEEMKNFSFNPKISFIMPTYKSNKKYLSECIDSVIRQKYTNWELCIADDASPDKGVTKRIIEQYAKKDERIKYIFRTENGHISEATNTALSISTGEYVVLIDHDDIVSDDALFEFVKVLNNEDKNSIKLIYSDEDKVTKKGKRFCPYFKPDFSPDTFNSIIFINHLTMYVRDIMIDIGGFDSDYNGAQDYEINLRYLEKIKSSEIRHIPKILYHWREAEGSIAENPENKAYAFKNSERALRKTINKKGIDYTLDETSFEGARFAINYKPKKDYKISIIICIRDKVDYLIDLINSIKEKTTYKNYEIIVVNNGSVEKKTLHYLEDIKIRGVKVLDVNEEFNFSKINNLGAKEASGEYLLFLNNDTEVITSDWLERMLGYAQQEHIGAVGAKLFYEDNTIQHAGVVLGYGLEGVAGHIFSGQEPTHTGYFGSLEVPYNYSAVTAACLMISKIKFKKVDGFDEELKVAYNDVDLCLKLIKKGYYNVYLPNVQLYHYESKSRGVDDTEEKIKRLSREIDVFKKRWGQYIKNDPFYNINLSLSNNTPYEVVINKEKEFKNKMF